MVTKRTTIQLSQETKDKLALNGGMNDTYEDVIIDLIHKKNFYEIMEYTDESATDFKKELYRIFDIINYQIPNDIDIDGVIEVAEINKLNKNSERIIEVYCTIENILSPN